jgi:hypothetical protein
MNALFAIERDINDCGRNARACARSSAAIGLGARRPNEIGKAIDYILERWAQKLDLRRFRRRRPPRRRHLHLDPDRQVQRHRSAGLACRSPQHPIMRISELLPLDRRLSRLCR